jgi:hypothetical protein
MPKESHPRTAVPTWDSMSPGEKQAWLLNQALDCKRDILNMPLPDPNDDSIEANRLRALVLDAADSTIEQTIRLQTNQLRPSTANDEIGELLEERRQRALLEIERMSAERNEYGEDEFSAAQAELGLPHASGSTRNLSRLK